MRTRTDETAAARRGAPPQLELLHFVPGRVRLRLEALRGRREDAAAFEAQLRDVPGVHRVQANPLTGSVVLHYEKQPGEAMLDALRRVLPVAEPTALEEFAARAAQGLGRAVRAQAHVHHRYWAERLLELSRRVNETVGHSTGGFDLGLLLPALLVAVGTYRMLTTRPKIPTSYELFWFAFNTFSTLQRGPRA